MISLSISTAYMYVITSVLECIDCFFLFLLKLFHKSNEIMKEITRPEHKTSVFSSGITGVGSSYAHSRDLRILQITGKNKSQ